MFAFNLPASVASLRPGVGTERWADGGGQGGVARSGFPVL